VCHCLQRQGCTKGGGISSGETLVTFRGQFIVGPKMRKHYGAGEGRETGGIVIFSGIWHWEKEGEKSGGRECWGVLGRTKACHRSSIAVYLYFDGGKKGGRLGEDAFKEVSKARGGTIWHSALRRRGQGKRLGALRSCSEYVGMANGGRQVRGIASCRWRCRA